MKTKLRTCTAWWSGVSRHCQEGVRAGRGRGCRFDKLDFWVRLLGLGLFWAKIRGSWRGRSPRSSSPRDWRVRGDLAAYLISMVFGWRQEFSCGFGAAWTGPGRRPSLSNVLPPRAPRVPGPARPPGD